MKNNEDNRTLYLITDYGSEIDTMFNYVKITDEQYNFYEWLKKHDYIYDTIDFEQVSHIDVDEP